MLLHVFGYAIVARWYETKLLFVIGLCAPLRRVAHCISVPAAPFSYSPSCLAARVDVELLAASDANMRDSVAETAEITSYEKWIQQLAFRERAYLLDKDVTANGCCLFDSWIAVLSGDFHA
jgi:hypothetical protein